MRLASLRCGYFSLLALVSLDLWFCRPQPSLRKRISVTDGGDASTTMSNIKRLTPLLVKRSFKFYIEQFDPEKIYLL